MTMRRADYLAVVKAIKNFRTHFFQHNPATTKEQMEFLRNYNETTVVQVLCDQFKSSNPLFNKEKFMEAMEKE